MTKDRRGPDETGDAAKEGAGEGSSKLVEEPFSSDEVSKVPPKGDLRWTFKKAYGALPSKISTDFNQATGVEYGKFLVFLEGDDSALTWGEIEAIRKYVGVEVRAHCPATPKTDPMGEVRDLHHVLHIAGQLPRAFFRGHEDSAWELAPSAFRDGGPRAEPYLPHYDLERFVAGEFRRRAAAILPTVPAPDDHMTWLLYMQHYGTASRLLDWTENALVATYFAIAREADSDGQLWVLDPMSLNRCSGLARTDGCGTRRVEKLASEPFERAPFTAPAKIAAALRRQHPVAIRPGHLFPRMVAQQSVFTIHPDPARGLSLLETLDASGIVWYRIPRARKWWLLKQLVEAGVSKATLFPDLDGLSVGIREMSYTPPPHRFDPPEIDSPARE